MGPIEDEPHALGELAVLNGFDPLQITDRFAEVYFDLGRHVPPVIPSLDRVDGVALPVELDRLFASDITVRLASFSIYWGLYGVALVTVGFFKRAAVARYAGLALLAITTAKVLFIDLAEATNTWRVVSFGACGLLLIVTSIAYAKLGQLLKDDEEEALGNPQDEDS